MIRDDSFVQKLQTRSRGHSLFFSAPPFSIELRANPLFLHDRASFFLFLSPWFYRPALPEISTLVAHALCEPISGSFSHILRIAFLSFDFNSLRGTAPSSPHPFRCLSGFKIHSLYFLSMAGQAASLYSSFSVPWLFHDEPPSSSRRELSSLFSFLVVVCFFFEIAKKFPEALFFPSPIPFRAASFLGRRA